MNDFEKNNFADFTASSAMKDIGFDDGVIAYYNKSGYITYAQPTIYGIELLKNSKEDDEVGAPLHQQAITWFLKQHGLCLNVSFWFEGKIYCWSIWTKESEDNCRPVLDSAEETEPEAYNAAIIKACKIVKEKQNE